MAIMPQLNGRPSLYFEVIDEQNVPNTNIGYLFRSCVFTAMVNGGYSINALFADAHSNLFDDFIRKGYFERGRRQPLVVKFSIRTADVTLKEEEDIAAGENSTRMQYAIVTSIKAYVEGLDLTHIEMTAIDPPTYYLNCGQSAGGAFRGSVSQAIEQCVRYYFPKDSVKAARLGQADYKVEVTPTIDSSENKWYMMRQDPKTFISSLLDWSCSLTPKKTQWMVSSDGYKLEIVEQAQLKSVPRAYYRAFADKANSTILGYEILMDNSQSLTNTVLTTQGASATTGNYFDSTTLYKPFKTIVNDKATKGKQIADAKEVAFKKQDDIAFTAGAAGSTSIIGIPEVYSAGELGLSYIDYLDGRARGMYLNMTQGLIKIRLEVLGHAIYRSCKGLGVDTVYVRYVKGEKGRDPGAAAAEAQEKHHWITGNWIIYGFKHKIDRGQWTTDLYLCRYDANASGKKVGGRPLSGSDRD
jgi:hypothetical protein